MDLSTYIQPLLVVAGGLMQFLRAQKAFPEWGYHVSAFALTLGAYGLTHEPPAGANWRLEAITGILWLSGALPAVWGGTFAASNAAKAGLPLPMTNSK